jgi:hypothetical protein
MKLDESTRFPYPVLWDRTGDYTEGEFTCSAQVEENLTTGEAIISLDFTLSHTGIAELIDSRMATAGVIVECAETYLNRLIATSVRGEKIRFPGGALSGRVVLRPAVWTREPIEHPRLNGLHPEFGKPTRIAKGVILALASEIVIEVGRDKLAPLETIFDLSLRDDVPEGHFHLDLESERIQIVAGRMAHSDISGMRNSASGRSILLSCVYLPAIIGVLHSIQGNSGSYEGRRWHRVLTARLSSMGIDPDQCDPLAAAQTLLKSPFARTAAVFKKGQD